MAAVPNIVIFPHCDPKIGDIGGDASVSNNESSPSGHNSAFGLDIHRWVILDGRK